MNTAHPQADSLQTTLRELDSKVDSVRETAIRTESKLEAYASRTSDTETEIKSLDLRTNELEKKVENMQGGMRMLQYIGGIIGGLVLIGQLAVMIIKG